MTENNDNVLPAGSVPLAGSLPLVAKNEPEQPKFVVPTYNPIEIQLADGRKIIMAKPKISLSDKVACVMQNYVSKDVMGRIMEEKRVKSLLYIESIDGVTELKISEPIMRAGLEQKLGDENLDTIFAIYSEHFQPADAKVLGIVKK